MAVKVLQVHKRSSYEFKYVQDKYAFSEKIKCYSIADGTTQSFNSELWAAAITKDFIDNPTFQVDEVITAFTNSARKFRGLKYEFSSNPAKASLEKEKLKKGATATFIGAKISFGKELSIISSGDSNVFIIRDRKLLSFPFKTSTELDGNNFFLNTEKLQLNEVDESFFYRNTIPIDEKDVIILATDALSRLLLERPGSIDNLIQLDSFDSFQNFCLKNWDSKAMEEDDITALIIHDFNSDEVKEILPSESFSFPREAELEFVPASPISSPNNELDTYDMHQLLSIVNRLNTELIDIKRRYRFQEILLIFVISLMAINIYMILGFRKDRTVTNQSELLAGFKEQVFLKDALIQEKEVEITRLKRRLEDRGMKPLEEQVTKPQEKETKTIKETVGNVSSEKEKPQSTKPPIQKAPETSIKKATEKNSESKSDKNVI